MKVVIAAILTLLVACVVARQTPAGYESLGSDTVCRGDGWESTEHKVFSAGDEGSTLQGCADACTQDPGCTAFDYDRFGQCYTFGMEEPEPKNEWGDEDQENVCYKKTGEVVTTTTEAPATTTEAPPTTTEATTPPPAPVDPVPPPPPPEGPTKEPVSGFAICKWQARFDIMMCKSHMCNACVLSYCMDQCQEVQRMFPGCRCSHWPDARLSYSGGDFEHKGLFGDAGDYSHAAPAAA